MIKRIISIITLILAGLFLWQNYGCASEPEDNGFKSQLDGQVNVTIVKEDTLFFPTITGNVVMSAIPDKLEVVIQGLIIPVNVVSQTVSANGLYVLHFRTVHSFNELKANTPYNVDLRFTLGGKTFRVEKFATFTVTQDYFGIDGQTMDLDSNWSVFD